MKKCPRFFSDCKNNTKARSWPTMSTTTIVSCSTSLHRHFLDMSRHSIPVKTTSHTTSPLPDFKLMHLMSGHFPRTNPKPKKLFNLKSIQHGFSQCCLKLFTMNHHESHPLSDVLHGPSGCTLGLLMNSSALAMVNCTSPTAAKTPLSAADTPRPTPKPTPTATPRLTPSDFQM